MRRIVLIILFIVYPLSAHAWVAKVVSVIDGDSIRVFNTGTGQIKIRLYGIDAPEKGQVSGPEAKARLESLVAGAVVEIDRTGKDPYGNTVGIVWNNGQNVNREMVRSGYAWLYRRYCGRPFCGYWLTLEDEAKKGRSGLWQGENPVEPWNWRRINCD